MTDLATRADLLRGVRVLDLSRVISGPFCTRMLADLGAEVIKVESPGGDPLRAATPVKGGMSAQFAQFNAGKRSVCIDYRDARGIDLIRRMAARCDVFVQNLRAGLLDRIGLGYEALCETNPRLVYCSISGFGQTGEDAHRPAYTDIIQALGGIDHAAQHMANYDGDGPPGVPVSLADTNASLNATIAILAALFHRQAGGSGQHIDLSMLDALVAANDTTVQRHIFSDGADSAPSMIFRPPLKMRDGFMAASVGLSFGKMVRAMGCVELLDDARFATPALQRENMAPYLHLVRAWAAQHTVAEATLAFDAHDIPYGPVRSPAEIVDDPLLRARGMFPTVELPGAGAVPVINTPFRFSGGTSAPQGPPPRLGEDTRAVLDDWLALSSTEWAALDRDGVVRTSASPRQPAT